ncbi:MAG: phosphodiester glycosidase family protein [Hyphomicrobiales bacterium]
MMKNLWMALAFATGLSSTTATATTPQCSDTIYLGKNYTVCEVDLRKVELELFWRDDNGRAHGKFAHLRRKLKSQGIELAFAMNGGMYHKDLSPVGLFVANGKELSPLNQDHDHGNFFLKPNGVFYWRGDQAGILETDAFQAKKPEPEFATQSGPMLVINGKLHPAFIKDSPSLRFRNGVGLRSQHQLVFVISREVVNFHEFATLFRDEVGCENALYLDGTVSALYAPPAHGIRHRHSFGPILGITQKQNAEAEAPAPANSN